ncbi:MAG: TolC family protein [Anaeromyxobacteraceae bacterium]
MLGRLRAAFALAAAALFASATAAEPAAPAASPSSPVLPGDPVLARLVEESLAARPELAAAEAGARAERERVPQAGALPDPVLSLGIQNDGFDEIMIGKMETSYWQVMLSQGLPWFGKRDLRNDVARLAADEAGASVSRARLAAEADVRRAYLELLVARDRLALLGRLEAVWAKSADLARARYQTGEGAQSDQLRAQLEQHRLKQRRWALEADERTARERLNRLRGKPLDAPVETTASLADAPIPSAPALQAAVDDALRRSPELARARTGAERAHASVRLAERDRWPDVSVQAGYMGRGALGPMWQAGLSVPLPVWSGRKQGAAVKESAARAQAEDGSLKAVEEVVRLRAVERDAVLRSLGESARLYRDGLLVLSRATLDSTLAQYAVGRVTFASVLEASAGYVADEEGHLGAVADALRVAIQAGEVSLDPVGSSGGGAMGGGGVPGAGAVAAPSGGGAAKAAAGGGAAAGGAGMSSGGM